MKISAWNWTLFKWHPQFYSLDAPIFTIRLENSIGTKMQYDIWCAKGQIISAGVLIFKWPCRKSLWEFIDRGYHFWLYLIMFIIGNKTSWRATPSPTAAITCLFRPSVWKILRLKVPKSIYYIYHSSSHAWWIKFLDNLKRGELYYLMGTHETGLN